MNRSESSSKEDDTFFVTNVISLSCSSILCKTDVRHIIDSLECSRSERGSNPLKGIKIHDSSQAFVTFSNIAGAFQFHEALSRSKPKWLITHSFIKGSLRLSCRHLGQKYLAGLLCFENADHEGNIKSCSIAAEGIVSSLGPPNNFLLALRAFTENKLKNCDSRNEYDAFILLFTSERALRSFYTWLRREKLYEDFVKLVDQVSYLNRGGGTIDSSSLTIKSVNAYTQFQDKIEKDGFSVFMDSNQIFESQQYAEIASILPARLNEVGICSLCFKMLSNKSTCLLQMGVEITSLKEGVAKPFTQQYSIAPTGATKEELLDYGYNFLEEDSKFVQKVNCDYLKAAVDVLPEKDAIARLISDVEKYASSSSVHCFFMLVHSNFISLPLFLQALSKMNKLSTFRRISLGVVDLANIVPLDKKCMQTEEFRSVLVPPLDTIFLKLSLPPRNIHDPVVLTAVRMRECLQRVTRHSNNLLQTLRDISHPHLIASDTFFCKEILSSSKLTIEESKHVWINFRRKEYLHELVFIPGSEFQLEISEFDFDKENYLFKISNKKSHSLCIPANHQLGYIVSSPRVHLCANHLSFLPPIPIPCWVGLQINALWPKSMKPQSPCSFLTNLSVDLNNHTWIKPGVAECECNIFLISIRTEGNTTTISQVSLLSIDANEERSYDYYYSMHSRNVLKCPQSVGKSYHKVITHQHLSVVQSDFSSLKTELLSIPNLVLVGYDIGQILGTLMPQLGGLVNLIGVTELAWCLIPTYDKIQSWFQLVDFPEEDLEECAQMNQISQAALQKTLNSLSFNYDNFVRSYSLSYNDFYNKYGCKANLDNAAVLKLCEDKLFVFVDVEYHEGSSKSLRCIRLKCQNNATCDIEEILPLNLSRSELHSAGYVMGVNSSSWELKGVPVVELPSAMATVVSFLMEQKSSLIIVTSTVQVRQYVHDALSFHQPSSFRALREGVIHGWCDLLSTFYDKHRPHSFVGVQRSSAETVSVLHEYQFNGAGPPCADPLASIEKIFGALSPPKVERQLAVTHGSNYITFFICVKSLDIASDLRSPFINPKTIGLIGCYSVHNSYSSVVPLIPPPNACPKSIEDHHFVKNGPFDLWEYNCVKHRDCHSPIKAFSFLMSTVNNEVQKMGAEGALLVTLTGEELSYFLANVQSLNLSKKFLKGIVGVGDISSYLQNERQLENVSSLKELHRFYIQNVDSYISSDPHHFSSVPPSILTKYLSFLARHLVGEDFYKLTHPLGSDYFNSTLLASNLIDFQEGSCDIVVASDSTIPAKSKMRVDARLKGFLFTNGVDVTMKISSPNLKCPIKVEESTLLFFKNHSTLISIENLDKVPVVLAEGTTILGRALCVDKADPGSPPRKNPLLRLARAAGKRPAATTPSPLSSNEEPPCIPPKQPRVESIIEESNSNSSEEIKILVEPVPICEQQSSPPSFVLQPSPVPSPPLPIPAPELPPEEEVRHELQGFDALCMDASYEPFLLTLLRIWSLQKKPFDHERGDALIFRLMSVGMGLDSISKLVQEKKCGSVEELRSELFAENIVLQDMLADFADLFFEVASVHFLDCRVKRIVMEDEESPPPLKLASFPVPVRHVEEKTMEEGELPESKEECNDDNVEEDTKEVVKEEDTDDEEPSRGPKLFEILSWSDPTDLLSRLCLTRTIRKTPEGLMISELTHPFVGRITSVPWEHVYENSHLRNIEEGIYLRQNKFIALKNWISFQDCALGFIIEVGFNELVIGYLKSGTLVKVNLPRNRLLFFSFLSYPGRSVYLAICKRNEYKNFAFGIPVLSLSSHTFVAPADGCNTEGLERLRAFLQDGLIVTSASDKKTKKEVLVCECANRKIYEAVESIILHHDKVSLKVIKLQRSICMQGCLDLTTDVKSKYGIISFIDRSGKIALVGEEVDISWAVKHYSLKFKIK